MDIFQNYKIPKRGYILEKWNISGYRATAIAYLEREKIDFVENINGKTYSLETLKNNLIK